MKEGAWDGIFGIQDFYHCEHHSVLLDTKNALPTSWQIWWLLLTGFLDQKEEEINNTNDWLLEVTWTGILCY